MRNRTLIEGVLVTSAISLPVILDHIFEHVELSFLHTFSVIFHESQPSVPEQLFSLPPSLTCPQQILYGTRPWALEATLLPTASSQGLAVLVTHIRFLLFYPGDSAHNIFQRLEHLLNGEARALS